MAPQRVEGERYASAPVGAGGAPPSLGAPDGVPLPLGAVGLKDVAEAERGTADSFDPAGAPLPSGGVDAMAGLVHTSLVRCRCSG